jgi:hypothetical protein
MKKLYFLLIILISLTTAGQPQIQRISPPINPSINNYLYVYSGTGVPSPVTNYVGVPTLSNGNTIIVYWKKNNTTLTNMYNIATDQQWLDLSKTLSGMSFNTSSNAYLLNSQLSKYI